MAFMDHELYDALGDLFPHVVVQLTTGQDDFRVVAKLLGPLSEVVGIDSDAMPANEPRAERLEIPLGPGRFEDGIGINPHTMENHAELVDEGDVDIALGVLNDLGRFGNLDAGSQMRSCGDDRFVEGIDDFADLGGRS